MIDFATSARILELQLRQREGSPDAPGGGACEEPKQRPQPVRRMASRPYVEEAA